MTENDDLPYSEDDALNTALRLLERVDVVGGSYPHGMREAFDEMDIRPDLLTEHTGSALPELWAGMLMKCAREINSEIDSIFRIAMSSGDSFFNGKKSLRHSLDSLVKLRSSLRDLEIDCEKFLTAASIRRTMIDRISSHRQGVVKTLERTTEAYNRAYNLCLQKLQSIDSGRVSATNILLSTVAVVLALLSLYQKV